jgi:hypothetical protein
MRRLPVLALSAVVLAAIACDLPGADATGPRTCQRQLRRQGRLLSRGQQQTLQWR